MYPDCSHCQHSKRYEHVTIYCKSDIYPHNDEGILPNTYSIHRLMVSWIHQISVVMPVYNAEKYIAEAIESVLNQTCQNFELIIVDDGSTDGTIEIIKSFKNNKVVLIQKEHSGIVDSLNIGIKRATGKYIARMDADDIMHIDRLKIQHAIMEEEPTITVCGTWMIPFGENVQAGRISQCGNGVMEFPLLQLLKGNFMFHPTIMMRKDFLDHHSLQYKNYQYAEDYQLWSEIAKRNGLFYIESQPLLYYRISEAQVSSTNQEDQRETSRQIKQEILDYLIELNKENCPEITTLYNSFLPLKEQNWLTVDDIFTFFYTFFMKNKGHAICF